MEKDSDSESCLGSKRRISELDSEIEGTQHIVDEQPSDSLSLEQPSSGIVSSTKEDGESLRSSSDFASESGNGLQKKAKSSSSDESEPSAVVQEKQETVDNVLALVSEVKVNQKIDEDNLGSVDDVILKVKGHEGRLVNEDLAKSELGFSGTQEFDEVHESSSSRSSCAFTTNEGQMDSVVQHCNKGLVTSCAAFDGNESELFLRNKEKKCLVESEVEFLSDAKNHVLKPTDSESSRTILDDTMKIKEDFEHSLNGEPGTVKRVDTDENGNICQEIGQNDGEKPDGLKGIGGAINCSFKIKVIDETAVIETVPASKVGLVCGKEKRFMGFVNHSERNGNKKNMKEEADENKEKRSRRTGKGGKKASGTNEKEKILSQIAEAPIACEIKRGEAKRAYSKKQMESLRFVNVEAQQKKWIEVYCGLGPSVAREYDSLVECNHQKHIHVNFDPRKQFGKKAEGSGILSEECSRNVDNELENMNPRDPACGLSMSDLDGCTAVEGECSEDETSDEDCSSIQRPAFFVTGKPNFDSGPPEDGLEYLRRVRWEAAQIPKVKVAKLERKKLYKEQTLYMPKIPDIAKCPEHLLPLKEWEDAFLADFSELRLALSRFEGSCAKISDKVQSLSFVLDEENSQQLPESMILENFDNFTSDGLESCQAPDCSVPESFSNPILVSNADEKDTSLTLENSSHKSFPDGCSGNSPTLSAILRMDSVARISTLRRRINSLEMMNTLSRNDCAWLYALCAAVDTPLDGDTSAALRCLLRKSASLRAGKSELDDEIIMLNILATISGRYFGQLDN